MDIYALTSEDLTHLGLCMGMEHTIIRWTKYFHTIDGCKNYAQNDFKPNAFCKIKTIEWEKTEYGFKSQDLSHTQYYIDKISEKQKKNGFKHGPLIERS
jgi:hypothetical protein